MDETRAKSMAAEYAAANLPALGARSWRGKAFEGGWLLNPEGDDLAWRTGVACLIVLEDGSIHEESSSLPPGRLIAKYQRHADG